VSNALVDMYAKCGSIENALRVFTKMPIHDVVVWNSIILGNVKVWGRSKGNSIVSTNAA
jgi:pentatricopeptide repeat protein